MSLSSIVSEYDLSGVNTNLKSSGLVIEVL